MEQLVDLIIKRSRNCKPETIQQYREKKNGTYCTDTLFLKVQFEKKCYFKLSTHKPIIQHIMLTLHSLSNNACQLDAVWRKT